MPCRNRRERLGSVGPSSGNRGPGMDGYELARKALGVRRDLKVLLLSGREPDGQEFPLIRKPFLEEDLRRVMQQTTGVC